MARTKSSSLRLRSTAGLQEDVTIGLPISWAAGLRERAGKLGLSIESVVVQLCGHAASELGQLHKAAVDGPRIGDDPSRVVLRDSMLRSFSREALRTGLSVRVLLHRSISEACDVFDGRQKQAPPKPLQLIPGQKKLGRR